MPRELVFGAVSFSLFVMTIGLPVYAAEAAIDFQDLDAWHGQTGEWVIAGDVTQDPEDPKRLAWSPGTGVAVNGEAGRTRHLVTRERFGDAEVHIEFMVPEGSNSGVYIQGRYEIQVFDSWGVEEPKHSDCGGIYQRWNGEPGIDDAVRGFEGRPPRVNASRTPGEWQSFDITFRAPRFDEDGRKTADAVFVKVMHNGTVIHENEVLSGPTRAALFENERPLGPIMLQGDHGPVAYRNIRIRPLTAGAAE